MECEKCRKIVFMPFRCPYCGGYFCSEHRLPENHECPHIELARIPKKEEPQITQYKYEVTYIPTETRKFHFSRKEIQHLSIGAILVLGIGLSWGISPYAAIKSPFALLVFALILTVSFFIHELAHKFVAQRAGLWAEFRLMFTGVLLTALSMVSPFFKIISPGAVLIAGFAGKQTIGKTSLAGPLTNIILSGGFIELWLMTPQPIFMYGAAFNAWIALFNLIPFGVLDGFKIFSWNKIAWTSTFTLSLAFTVLTYFYF